MIYIFLTSNHVVNLFKALSATAVSQYYKATQIDFIDNTDIMHKLQTAHSLNG